MARDVIEMLNDLILLDRDAVSAYDQAIGACDSAILKETLTTFRSDHERHVADLSAEVRTLGGTPEVGRDLKGMVIEEFTAITSHGDQSALMAMRGNEELTNRKYASALDEGALTQQARAVVERNYDDEKRHLAWIKDALARKIWEKAA